MLEQEREGVVLLRVLYFGGGWLEKFLHLSEEFICKPNNVIYVELCLYSAVQNLYGTINSSRWKMHLESDWKILNWGRSDATYIAFDVANITPDRTFNHAFVLGYQVRDFTQPQKGERQI